MSREYTLTEISNALFNLIRIGKVCEIAPGGKKVKVAVDGVPSAWTRWGETSAGEVRTWSPPVLNEQVLLLALGGDTRQSFIITRLNQDSFDSPFSDPNIHGVKYSDGAELYYNRETHELKGILPSGGKVHIVAPGGFKFEGDSEFLGKTTFQDDMQLNANFDSNGEMKNNGKDVGSTHNHNYRPGPGSPTPSDPPNP